MLPDANPLEWWYLNGTYEAPGIKRHFMIALFRTMGAAEGGAAAEGHQLLVCSLDETTGRYDSASFVSPGLLALSDEPEQEPLNIDRRLMDIFRKETREGAPYHPIRLREPAASITAEPLHLDWGDFTLSDSSGAFRLEFTEPQTGSRCTFDLAGDRPAVSIAAAAAIAPGEERMHYRTFPRLRLTGEVDGHPAEGVAWLDHQWGGYGWLISRRDGRRVLAWDWLGISLEDGTDWVVMAHRDAQTGRVLAQHVTIADASGATQLWRDFTFEPTRFWESPRTLIRYPVEWRVEVPAAQAVLSFTPLADDQETPVFGLMRAIWEGAGRVEGTVGGAPVKGRATGEAHGYGYIFDLDDHLARAGARVEKHIAALLPYAFDESHLQKLIGPATWEYEAAAYTPALAAPLWDLLHRSSKRWRPLFGMLMLETLGTDPRPYESLVSVLAELPHTGSLIIDDIEDNSTLRRGGPCIHLTHGVDIAINAANTLYFLPLLPVAGHPLLTSEHKLCIHQILAQQYVKAHMGQALDLHWTRSMCPELLEEWLSDSLSPKIMEMYALKTAAIMEGLAEVAGIIAGASPEVRAACVAFARNMAVAFQIADDVYCFSSSPRWRKTLGEDLTGGKLTFAIHRALEQLEDADRERLGEILCSRDAAALQEGIDLMRKSGALDSCLEQARSMMRSAWSDLVPHLRPSEARLLLRALCENLVDLNLET